MGGTRHCGAGAVLAVCLGFGVWGVGWPDVAPAVGGAVVDTAARRK